MVAAAHDAQLGPHHRHGEDRRSGLSEWDAYWDNDSRFSNQLRVLTAAWGTVFTLDAAIRVAFA